MKKSLILLLLMIVGVASGAWAQGEPKKKVAVYMTANDADPGQKKVIASKLVTAITQTREYAAVERTEDFLNALRSENNYQVSGEVRDSQIAQLGIKFGVKFVVVVDVSEVYDELFVTARMINVETGLVEKSAEEFGAVESARQLVDFANSIAKKLLGGGRTVGYSGGSTGGSGVQTFTVNGVSFSMVPVQGGTYMMGSYDPEADNDEKYVHGETIGDFMIGQTEVTQELWIAVMGSNPSRFTNLKNPVDQVSWIDCQNFIRQLNQLTGQNFRLPTEAEWEYAARGGNKSRGFKYSGSNNLTEVGWYDGNSGGQTRPVATRLPNELDIYDMSGNVWEWCNDYWSSGYNQPRNGSARVLRGGSWYYDARSCRVADRGSSTPGGIHSGGGFRLAL